MGETKKTVRVRIAVAVGENGLWNAAGRSYWPEDQVRRGAANAIERTMLDSPAPTVYWLEADLPIPEQQTFEASVVEAATPTGGGE